MSLVVRCPRPECGHEVRVVNEAIRPEVCCPGCGHTFTLSEAIRLAGGDDTLPPPAGMSEPAAPEGPSVQIPGHEVHGELGRGAMGVVYRARQAAAGREVAVKMILAGDHTNAETRRRFLAEARAVARLEHPNVVPLFEVGECQGHPFFSLPYIPGGTLADRLEQGPLEPAEASAWPRRWPGGSTRRTGAASSIATSSPPTS